MQNMPVHTHKEARLASQGRLEEAGPLFERAIAIWEAAQESGHPKVAAALSDWAKVLKAQMRGLITPPLSPPKQLRKADSLQENLIARLDSY